MKNLILLFIVLLLSGCTSYTLKNGRETMITDNQRIYSHSGLISASAPNNFPKKPFVGYTRFDKDYLNFERHLPNMMSEDVSISVSIPKRLKKSTEKFFDKYFDFEKWGNEVLKRPDIVKNMQERGVKYSKKYIDYIGGLKCSTDVEAANIVLGVAYKKYYTVCGYYDTNGVKKRIDIFYNYTYTHSGIKYDSDKQSSSFSPEAMQMQFKKDMKAIFDSLVIYDMDRKKMAIEGLLHDEKYQIQKW